MESAVGPPSRELAKRLGLTVGEVVLTQRRCRRYPDTGLVLSGPQGAGKDSLADELDTASGPRQRVRIGSFVQDELTSVIEVLRRSCSRQGAFDDLVVMGISPACAKQHVDVVWSASRDPEFNASLRTPLIRAALGWHGRMAWPGDQDRWLRRAFSLAVHLLLDGSKVTISDARTTEELRIAGALGFVRVWIDVPPEVRRDRVALRDGPTAASALEVLSFDGKPENLFETKLDGTLPLAELAKAVRGYMSSPPRSISAEPDERRS